MGEDNLAIEDGGFMTSAIFHQDPLPEHAVGHRGGILRFAGRRGVERRRILTSWLERAAADADAIWYLDCDMDRGGLWGGVHDLFSALLPELQAAAPDLVRAHDYELLSVLPELRGTLSPRFPTLTDLAPPSERVRLYPADRAVRLVHGLIDLLAEWKVRRPGGLWVMLCDDFDHASHLSRRFFTELVRRRGRSLDLVLCTVEEGEVSHGPGEALRLDCAADPAVSPGEMTQQALLLEEKTREGGSDLELNLPLLIDAWKRSDHPDRRFEWQYEALSLATQRGFYLDALQYGEDLVSCLAEFCGDDELKRWRVVSKAAACYCAAGRAEQALALTLEEALGKLTSGKLVAQAHYTLAMLHARFLPQKDFALAEEHLEQGIAELLRADLPDDEREFDIVFNRNGLAFVRHRQGAHDEAIELCRAGLESLETHLSATRHRLHRSVLRYNIAQVYAATGRLEEALVQYTKAMEMDVNYSEYYNERGNVLFRLGRVGEAVQDYQQARLLSPPYSEVLTNLGQCFRARHDFEQAIHYFDAALDLDPNQPFVHVMRAECKDALGLIEEALAGYDAALILDERQPLVLGNRACLQYQLGSLQEALADLNRAIELAPDAADLYRNRATALASLHQPTAAARDLENYLTLRPDCEDRQEILAELAGLDVFS
jgi:tetratricopeptide (TPR) repeat protein